MIHPDVAEAHRLMELLGRECSSPCPEAENAEYGAAVATNGKALVRFRVGKLTPSKVGLFVAVWQRSIDGGTEPFPADHPSADDADTLVVSVREDGNFGHFVFPTVALIKHGIVSVKGKGGKRGFRVYPPWSPTSNRQARMTQEWQSEFFQPWKPKELPAG
jgi:hypothetical protein